MRAAVALAALVGLATGCDRSPSAAVATPSWPAGTVLAVEDRPILAEEVDQASVFVERVEPQASPPQLRRLALTNVVLPRTVARLLAPEAYERARGEAQAQLARIQTGTLAGPPGPEGRYGTLETGGWPELGLVAWGTAMDLPDEQWSGVVEEVGHFIVLRRVGREEGPLPMATRVTVEAFVFPWLPSAELLAEVDAAYDRFQLTIVDPAWRAIVPELVQARMRARRP